MRYAGILADHLQDGPLNGFDLPVTNQDNEDGLAIQSVALSVISDLRDCLPFYLT